jgi:nucleoside-diphosphate-sugar epimerase
LLAIGNPDASAGQVYNIRDANKTTNPDQVSAAARVTNHHFEFVDMPLNIVRSGYGYAYPPALMYPYHQIMDMTKVKEQLGYWGVAATERAVEKSVEWLLGTRDPNLVKKRRGTWWTPLTMPQRTDSSSY